ncbi:hypothetical protein BCR34DRAFT_191088 [Clohesyomyces aquaticus]|uniref:Uncharacterized protein n=1 Tax=Clohesyomyces aquaticus TaxID=1231657 RepID=A0A1Y1ZY68_9PLEO|nr:hypothetical protein BCR34DRAFT_191088 [Clohesyomyces aquaticus]
MPRSDRLPPLRPPPFNIDTELAGPATTEVFGGSPPLATHHGLLQYSHPGHHDKRSLLHLQRPQHSCPRSRPHPSCRDRPDPDRNPNPAPTSLANPCPWTTHCRPSSSAPLDRAFTALHSACQQVQYCHPGLSDPMTRNVTGVGPGVTVKIMLGKMCGVEGQDWSLKTCEDIVRREIGWGCGMGGGLFPLGSSWSECDGSLFDVDWERPECGGPGQLSCEE